MNGMSALHIFVYVAIASLCLALAALAILLARERGRAEARGRLETCLKLMAVFSGLVGLLVLYLGEGGTLPVMDTVFALSILTAIYAALFWIAHKKLPRDRDSDNTDSGQG